MVLAVAAMLAAGQAAAQATLGRVEVPPVYTSAEKAFDGLGDYSAELGQVKVLKVSPLHLQIRAEVEAASVRQFPNLMVEQTAEVLAYGVFRTFIHTKANEVTVTALPVLQTYTDKGTSDKVLKDKAVQVRMTRAQAEAVAREVLGVVQLNDLVARETVGWGWSKPMQQALGAGGRGVDPALLKALGLQINPPR